MTDYINKPLLEKVALSPSFSAGNIVGMAVGAFNASRGKIYSPKPEDVLHNNQPITHNIAQYASPLIYMTEKLASIYALSSIGFIWTPAAIIADGLRNKDKGDSFSAWKAGYKYGRSFF